MATVWKGPVNHSMFRPEHFNSIAFLNLCYFFDEQVDDYSDFDTWTMLDIAHLGTCASTV